MHFEEFYYQQPDIEEFEERISKLLEDFQKTNALSKQIEIIDEINSRRNDVLTMVTIAQIRNMLNTKETTYRDEMKYINQKWGLYEVVVAKYYNCIVQSPFKEQLIQRYGKQLFSIAEHNVKTISDQVIKEIEVENNLQSEYTRMMAGAKIEFQGKVRNLSELDYFISSSDRHIRKEASEKKYLLMTEIEDKIDSIFDSLIKVRTKIAHKLGYKSFVELGYSRLSRVDYNQENVSNFRKMILEKIVPLSVELRNRQRVRLELDVLEHFDEDVRFRTENINPKGDADWIVSKFQKIFNEVSAEAGEVFNLMDEKNLLNLQTREGKAGGAFSTYLCHYKSPYIFANLNGSRRDVKVLAHEFGHAFQMAVFNRNNEIPEYILPTKEACEISSIAMEFLVWDWMEDIFDDNALKYNFAHLEDAIHAMCYRSSIDEFQHFVYSYPEITPKERKKKWKEIEEKYMPYKSSYNHPYLERGNLWQRQTHLFTLPFYYIDYALAQICALQIWVIAQINKDEAWSIYMKMANRGGSLSFLDLLKHSGLDSPFEEEVFNQTLDGIKTWFDNEAQNI